MKRRLLRRALVLEDDLIAAEALVALVEDSGFAPIHAASLEAARTLLTGDPFDLVVLDLVLPDGDGLDLLGPLTATTPRPSVLVLTGETRLERAVLAIQAGAADYLTKPLDTRRLDLALTRIHAELDQRDEREVLLAELKRVGNFHGLIGRSPAMRKVFDDVTRAAGSELPIYIVGESGSGKELLAQSVHTLSRRRKGPFVALNCGAIPRQLAESELFGHEAGAFTGAHRQHQGAFERSHGGTLFLDELTEMPLDLQVVLLRALETHKVIRVGGSRELSIDVRIVAASNRDPAQAVKDGRLREDLFFRLHVVPLSLPPLRQRGDDVLILAEHLLAEYAPDKHLSSASRAALRAHPFPGNVRELKNLITRAAVLSPAELIEPADLALESGTNAAPPPSDVIAVPTTATLAEAEHLLIEAALARHGHNRTHAAKALGIALKTLYNKLRR